MTKIVSGFLTLCLVAALSAGAQANNGNHNGWGHGNGMGHRHSCPPGMHWVKGYKNRYGKHVKGYCSR